MTGKIVPSTGPLNAKIVFVGESPGANEIAQGIPFVGRAGKMLDAALRNAGIDRNDVYLMNCIPTRAPGDKFDAHTADDIRLGRTAFNRELRLLTNARVFVALGANPTEWLLGKKPPVKQGGGKPREGFIGQWRGSAIPVGSYYSTGAIYPEDYVLDIGLISPIRKQALVVPTYHPAAVLRQFNWHPWFLMDIAKAAEWVDTSPALKSRKWYVQDVVALDRLANSEIDLISVDSELDPWIVGIATEDEVHVFEFNESFRPALTKLLGSDRILKVAHNWLHDYAFFRKNIDIKVSRPYFDTQGAAHILNNALQKELSPHIATRFTNWPYHKYLANSDVYTYCGMDAVVCYDAYWPMIEQLCKRELYWVADHDHKLLTALMDMQAVGFKIDEKAREDVEVELDTKLGIANDELQKMVAPVVVSKISRFKKPHLFQEERKCDCCGGGTKQRIHCYTCHAKGCTCLEDAEGIEGEKNYESKDYATEHKFKTVKEWKASWPECTKCIGTGRIIKRLEFNSDSPDQVADVLYRGLGIRARRFKGNETIKAAQLDAIRGSHPIIDKVIEVSEIRAEVDTVTRLRAGKDGLLHCAFDPWGTASGRVAGKEGLIEVGTNPMNLPKEARRFVVPRDGTVFLYPDMAQIEARALAVLSGDKHLIAAFSTLVNWPGHPKHGKVDSHTSVVQMMDDSGATITRDQAKRLVYAIMNGGRAAQLAVELNAEAFRKGEGANRLTTAQVQFMIDTFYRAYPKVKQWQLGIEDQVLRTRKLRCPFTGRERWWVGYIWDKRTKGLSYEIAKQVYSFLPQNLAAWILAEGLIDLYYNKYTIPIYGHDGVYNMPVYGTVVQPLIHVHDALLLEVNKLYLNESTKLIQNVLTRDRFGIRFEIGMKQGNNWLEASGD